MTWRVELGDSGILTKDHEAIAYFDEDKYGSLMADLVRQLNSEPPPDLIHYIAAGLAWAGGALSVTRNGMTGLLNVSTEPPKPVKDAMERYLEWLKEE